VGIYLELAERAVARLVSAQEQPVPVPSTAPSVGVPPGGVLVLQPGHWLGRFHWDGPGFSPGCPLRIIDGVTHKREDCCSRRSWRHVWGDRYCANCWPCTDPAAMANEKFPNSEPPA
jgi:hypothetical protein